MQMHSKKYNQNTDAYHSNAFKEKTRHTYAYHPHASKGIDQDIIGLFLGIPTYHTHVFKEIQSKHYAQIPTI